MADQPTQSYANHRRVVPTYHFLTAGILIVNFIYAIVHLTRIHTYGAAAGLGVALALLFMFFHARRFATTVQDRVIRLEESMRYQRVLPADLQARAAGLTVRQTIGLRFASDAELPALVRKALEEQLGEGAIKRQVTTWRADFLRA